MSFIVSLAHDDYHHVLFSCSVRASKKTLCWECCCTSMLSLYVILFFSILSQRISFGHPNLLCSTTPSAQRWLQKLTLYEGGRHLTNLVWWSFTDTTHMWRFEHLYSQFQKSMKVGLFQQDQETLHFEVISSLRPKNTLMTLWLNLFQSNNNFIIWPFLHFLSSPVGYSSVGFSQNIKQLRFRNLFSVLCENWTTSCK